MSKLNPKIQSIFQSMKVCAVPELNEWHLEIPGHLARKDYEVVKQVIHGLRGEWVRKKNTHVFLYDPSKEIRQIAESGITPDYIDNPHSFFPTPLEEVEDMVYVIGECRDWEHYRVLEPSAGDGRIIRSVLNHCPNAAVDYCEIDDLNLELLKPLPARCVGSDFLKASLEPIYDLIVMNPPFNGKEYQKHVKKALGLLKSDGRMVSVLPKMALSDNEFCNFLFKEGNSQIYLGEREFDGTKVNYVTVCITKGTNLQSVPYGHKSWAEYHLLLMLDNDYQFHQAIAGCQDREQLKKELKKAVDRIRSQDLVALCLDDELLHVAANYYLGETEEHQADDPITPIQRSLFDLAA